MSSCERSVTGRAFRGQPMIPLGSRASAYVQTTFATETKQALSVNATGRCFLTGLFEVIGYDVVRIPDGGEGDRVERRLAVGGRDNLNLQREGPSPKPFDHAFQYVSWDPNLNLIDEQQAAILERRQFDGQQDGSSQAITER